MRLELGARISLSAQTRKKLEELLRYYENLGNLSAAKRIMAILAVVDGNTYSKITSILKVCAESIRLWIKTFLLKGPEGLKSKKIPGRPSKLTKSQKEKLEKFIIEGPAAAGFPGACWRTPMIQHLIYEKFGVFYSVFYISQLLKNMGFSYQKAKFVSDHKDPDKRKKWLAETWPKISKLAEEKNAHILFGDEASFPQWGSLSYTWAKKGQQPVVKTSGVRKGYKVLGLIDYFSGRFFCKGHEGRLNSESYEDFLKEVLKQTNKHIILIQDGARYHTSKAMNEFFAKESDRITVYQLPSYSPDYNPIEKLWKKIKEKEIHLHYFPTFDSLRNKVEEALLHFRDLKNEVLSLFGFYNELAEA
ncbi:MAG: IS630 family transposase [bacterium]|nr:IS630 family transposase [bacterium]